MRRDISIGGFFTSLVYSRVRGFYTAFEVLSASVALLLGAGVYLLYVNEYAAAVTILLVAAFFFVPGVVMGICYLVYNNKYKRGDFPFVRILADDAEEALSVCDREYGAGLALYSGVDGRKTLERVVILPSYVVLIKPEIEIIPLGNIVWAFGNFSFFNYRVNGIKQRKRTHNVYIYFRGMTGRKKRSINSTSIFCRKREVAEAVLKAVKAANRRVLIGRSGKLQRWYMKDQERLYAFFGKYAEWSRKREKENENRERE